MSGLHSEQYPIIVEDGALFGSHLEYVAIEEMPDLKEKVAPV